MDEAANQPQYRLLEQHLAQQGEHGSAKPERRHIEGGQWWSHQHPLRVVEPGSRNPHEPAAPARCRVQCFGAYVPDEEHGIAVSDFGLHGMPAFRPSVPVATLEAIRRQSALRQVRALLATDPLTLYGRQVRLPGTANAPRPSKS
jgi:hypothetical protein